MLNPNKPKGTPVPRVAKPPPDPTVLEAQVHASKHRAELQSSELCGCYFCFRKFGFAAITKWIDANETALCPGCGIDAVIGSSAGYQITDVFLRKMHMHWFATSGSKFR